MKTYLYKVMYKTADGETKRGTLFANNETDLRDILSRMFLEPISINCVREATPDEYDQLAGGAPHPKH